MGLTPNEYYSMTPYEFELAAKGYTDRYWKGWEHTRHISYTIAQVNSSKKMPAPQKWMPLPTDKEYKPVTKREGKTRWNYLLNNLKDKKGKGIW